VAVADPYKVLGWSPDREKIYYQHRLTGQIANIKARLGRRLL
jgi:hypothetical protein